MPTSGNKKGLIVSPFLRNQGALNGFVDFHKLVVASIGGSSGHGGFDEGDGLVHGVAALALQVQDLRNAGEACNACLEVLQGFEGLVGKLGRSGRSSELFLNDGQLVVEVDYQEEDQ